MWGGLETLPISILVIPQQAIQVEWIHLTDLPLNIPVMPPVIRLNASLRPTPILFHKYSEFSRQKRSLFGSVRVPALWLLFVPPYFPRLLSNISRRKIAFIRL